METTEEIKTKDLRQDEGMQDDLFFAMLNGKTVQEKIKTTRGDFVVKFPKQKDILVIDRRIASMRAGYSFSSFDEVGNFNLQKIAFLDTVIAKGPAWYESAKQKNVNFGWGDMPDTNFVDEVYVKAWSFRTKVQEQLAEHAKKANRTSDKDTEQLEQAVGNGIFQGIAVQTEKS